MQGKEEKRRDDESGCDHMLAIWQQLAGEGVEFFVDGKSVPMKDAVSLAVREDSAYMADYIWGKTGRIQQIRLDKVESE